MITYEQMIAEMERQLKQAKYANEEQQMMEAIAALRALCEVMLHSTRTPVQEKQLPTVSSIMTHSKIDLQERPLLEEDANGESLFDF